MDTAYAHVNILTRGDLSSLRWIESSLKYFSANDKKESLCQVYYAPLNFRDIMLATGKLPPDAIPGLKKEFCSAPLTCRTAGWATNVLTRDVFLILSQAI